jgi:hypothetical protein
MFCPPEEWLGTIVCLNLATISKGRFVLSLTKLVYCTVLFITFSVNFLYSIMWLTIVKSRKENLNSISVIIIITLQSIPPIVSLYLSLIRRRVLVEQLNHINSVFKQLLKMGYKNKSVKTVANSMVFINLAVILGTIGVDIYMTLQIPPEDMEQKVLSSGTFYMSKLAYAWGETHFTLYLYIMTDILSHIKRNMIQILQKNYSTFKKKNTIKTYNAMFKSIIKISRDTNTDFSVQFLIGCVCFIFHTAFMMKLTMTDIYNNFTGKEVVIVRPAICMVFTVYGVLLMCAVVHVCASTTTEV